MHKTYRDELCNKNQHRDDIENKRDKGKHKRMDPYKRKPKCKLNYDEYE